MSLSIHSNSSKPSAMAWLAMVERPKSIAEKPSTRRTA